MVHRPFEKLNFTYTDFFLLYLFWLYLEIFEIFVIPPFVILALKSITNDRYNKKRLSVTKKIEV